jgi:glycosyltransferase involved in cell wall biosynthesis
MKRQKFNIVHTYLFSENILGVVAAKLAGVPVIITGRRDTGMLCQGEWYHMLAYRLTNPLVTKIVCVSEAVRKVVLEKERVASTKVEVIYNGVDVAAFGRKSPVTSHQSPEKNLKQELGIKDSDLVVGMIANFSWVKGHEVLIKAAPEVIKEVPNVKFVLIGEGVLLERTKSEVGSRKSENHFIFLGRRTDIPELLSIMDISVNLSYSEGMSNTILESMAAGVPVVATAVDGNLETVDENTGLLVRIKDPRVTAQAIIRLLKDENLRKRLGENARRAVQEKFDSKVMINKMETLYLKLLENRK